jgi:urocanate hydratase
MLMNNLDPDGRREPGSWSSMAASAAPRATGKLRPHRRDAAPLEDDETLLVQSGKPVGVFRTMPTRRAC